MSVVPNSLSNRDQDVLRLVAKFKQVSSHQVHALLFDGLSYMPANRTLKRLYERGYLARIERKIVGGSAGGSGQYVYQLGRKGFYGFYTGRYQPARAVNFHSLAIVDCYVIFRQLEREGLVTIRGMSTEPDSWVEVAGTTLKPDLFIDFEAIGKRYRWWLEIDMATEGQKQIRGKLEAYWRAFNSPDVADWPVFPQTVWVGVDDERAIELSWLIEQLSPERRELFQVATRETLERLITA